MSTKLTLVTTSRADWNAVGMLARAAKLGTGWPDVQLSIVAITASPDAHQALMMAIAEDNLRADIAKCCDLRRDEPPNLGCAAGKALSLAAEAVHVISPDWALVAGDRWEMLSAATAVRLAGVSLAHLGGGDETLGSYDDRLRMAITSLADAHFVTNRQAHQRLRFDLKLNRVFHTGSPAIDRLHQHQDRTVLPERPFILVNWQPETTADDPNLGLATILAALKHFPSHQVLSVGPNDDIGSDEARKMLLLTAQSLRPSHYLTLLKHCAVMVGNSSSGIIEAPYFGTPVVCVGQRQLGRMRWQNVIEVPVGSVDILVSAIKSQIGRRYEVGQSPYGNGDACDQIKEAFERLW